MFQWPALTIMRSFSSKALENRTHHTHPDHTIPPSTSAASLVLALGMCSKWLQREKPEALGQVILTYTSSSTLGNSSVHVHTYDCYTLERFGTEAISLDINTTTFLNHTLCNLVSKTLSSADCFRRVLD